MSLPLTMLILRARVSDVDAELKASTRDGETKFRKDRGKVYL